MAAQRRIAKIDRKQRSTIWKTCTQSASTL